MPSDASLEPPLLPQHTHRALAAGTLALVPALRHARRPPPPALQELPRPDWHCVECARSFGSFSALHSHVRSRKHSSRAQQCGECGRVGSATLAQAPAADDGAA